MIRHFKFTQSMQAPAFAVYDFCTASNIEAGETSMGTRLVHASIRTLYYLAFVMCVSTCTHAYLQGKVLVPHT